MRAGEAHAGGGGQPVRAPRANMAHARQSRPHIRQSMPHIRQSRPYIRQSRPHIRQSRPTHMRAGEADAGGSGQPLRAPRANLSHIRQIRPHIRQSRPYIRQSRPHIRQSRPYIRQSRPHIRQSRPDIRQSRPLLRQSRPTHMREGEAHAGGGGQPVRAPRANICHACLIYESISAMRVSYTHISVMRVSYMHIRAGEADAGGGGQPVRAPRACVHRGRLARRGLTPNPSSRPSTTHCKTSARYIIKNASYKPLVTARPTNPVRAPRARVDRERLARRGLLLLYYSRA